MTNIWFRINGGPWDNDPTHSPLTGVGGFDLATPNLATGVVMQPPFYPVGFMNGSATGIGPLMFNFGAELFQTGLIGSLNAWGLAPGGIPTTLDAFASAPGFGQLINGQLAMLLGDDLVFGLGYRATTSTATRWGLRYFEAVLLDVVGNWRVGVTADANFPVEDPAGGNPPLSAVVDNQGGVMINLGTGVPIPVFPALRVGDVIGVALNLPPPPPFLFNPLSAPIVSLVCTPCAPLCIGGPDWPKWLR